MKKRGIVSDYLPWLLIALAILVILFISIFIMKNKGEGLLEGLGGLFRR